MRNHLENFKRRDMCSCEMKGVIHSIYEGNLWWRKSIKTKFWLLTPTFITHWFSVPVWPNDNKILFKHNLFFFFWRGNRIQFKFENPLLRILNSLKAVIYCNNSRRNNAHLFTFQFESMNFLLSFCLWFFLQFNFHEEL